MGTAKAVPDTYLIRGIDTLGWLTLDCQDFDAYRTMPALLTHKGHKYVKAGWNSDLGRVYYDPRGDVFVAYANALRGG